MKDLYFDHNMLPFEGEYRGMASTDFNCLDV